jgi:hypothetical protein
LFCRASCEQTLIQRLTILVLQHGDKARVTRFRSRRFRGNVIHSRLRRDKSDRPWLNTPPLDREILLGHKSDHVTTHYSAAGTDPSLGEGVRARGSQKSRYPSSIRTIGAEPP